jgi:transcriptional regulator with XRE-family HTH domain
MRTLRETTAANIRRLRQSRGMSQQDLVDRVSQLGRPLDRTAVAKAENGRREVTIVEAFAFAWALDVAPVHLFVPADSGEPINLGPNMEATPAEVRAWIRGQRPLFQDPRVYFSAVPEGEFAPAREAMAAWQLAAPIRVTTEQKEGQ